MHVTFSRRHDHTFPSRAMVTYPAGWSGVVKREVGQGAVDAGAAKETRAKAASGGGGKGDPDKPTPKSRRGRPRKAAPKPVAAVVEGDPVPAIPVLHVPDLRDGTDSQ